MTGASLRAGGLLARQVIEQLLRCGYFRLGNARLADTDGPSALQSSVHLRPAVRLILATYAPLSEVLRLDREQENRPPIYEREL